jgi:hypothetical protein
VLADADVLVAGCRPRRYLRHCGQFPGLRPGRQPAERRRHPRQSAILEPAQITSRGSQPSGQVRAGRQALRDPPRHHCGRHLCDPPRRLRLLHRIQHRVLILGVPAATITGNLAGPGTVIPSAAIRTAAADADAAAAAADGHRTGRVSANRAAAGRIASAATIQGIGGA